MHRVPGQIWSGLAWAAAPAPGAALSPALSRNSFRESWCFPASQQGDKADRVSLVLAASQLTPLTGRFDLRLSRPNPKPGLLCQPLLTREKGISEGQFGKGQAAPCAQLALKHGAGCGKGAQFCSVVAMGERLGGGVGVLAEK